MILSQGWSKSLLKISKCKYLVTTDHNLHRQKRSVRVGAFNKRLHFYICTFPPILYPTLIARRGPCFLPRAPCLRYIWSRPLTDQLGSGPFPKPPSYCSNLLGQTLSNLATLGQIFANKGVRVQVKQNLQEQCDSEACIAFTLPLLELKRNSVGKTATWSQDPPTPILKTCACAKSIKTIKLPSTPKWPPSTILFTKCSLVT